MIREINNQDRLKIYKIIEEEFNVKYKNDNVFTHWYIYELNNEIIGFINFDVIYENSEIQYIYVDKNYRKQGIATTLLQKMFDNLDKEVKNISLEVRNDNIEAIEFYKKNGFKEVAVREKYYGDRDAILMLKSW